jgi:hypothetical protein
MSWFCPSWLSLVISLTDEEVDQGLQLFLANPFFFCPSIKKHI